MRATRPRPLTEQLPSVSGARASRYALVRQCMAQYISPIMVDSVLGKALESRDLMHHPLSESTMEAVVAESMIGLRLFVDPAKLPQLMVELAAILAREDL